MLQNVFEHIAKCNKPRFLMFKIDEQAVHTCQQEIFDQCDTKTQFLKWCDM